MCQGNSASLVICASKWAMRGSPEPWATNSNNLSTRNKLELLSGVSFCNSCSRGIHTLARSTSGGAPSRLDPVAISPSNFISLSHNDTCMKLATDRSAIRVLPISSRRGRILS